MKFQRLCRALVFLFLATDTWAATTVALMDFSTDDNSYRSAQSAVEFTTILQVQLADVSGIEWVERGRLDQARRELELSAMEAPGGVPYIRLGKWVKADWMVTGQFSVDDRNRRTLFLEITDLQHADVLASQRLIFPTNVVSQIKLEMPQVDFAAQTLRRLLSKAHLHQEQMADKVLVAPLFLADVTRFGHGFGFSRNTVMLEKDLNDALERAATADGHVHLISFPEAYRSLNESEMVLNGLIEADRNAWQQTADLYVWGTCATTSRMVPGKLPEEKMEIMLHIWNGASQPMILKEELPARAQANQIETAMEHLANQVIADAHKHTIRANPDAISRQIAESLLQAYDQMTLGTPHNREDFGLNDPEKFLQTIHMLETACFFDPDNVNARVLYITCRWGFWMDFTFKVKNEFWSKWRRSQAWGQYVEQFGLKPVAIELPFPYQQEDGIPQAYLQSLEDVLEMFPQWHSTNEMALEDEWQKQGVHTWLVEAEAHGFPKDMPNDLAWNWEKDVKAEYWQRLTRVAEYISDSWTPQGKMPPTLLSAVIRGALNAEAAPTARLALLEKIWPKCEIVARQYGQQWILGMGSLATDQRGLLTQLCARAGAPEKAGELLALLSTNQNATAPEPGLPSPAVATSQTAPSMVPIPKWMTEIQPTLSLFRLFPPNALPVEVQPAVRTFQFPKQFDVQAVEQMDFLSDKLLILAMDERSAPSSDPNPGVSAERLEKRGRLWVLASDASNPVLYEPEVFTETIRSFLLENHNLWIVGKDTGCLDLKTQKFRKFGLSNGLSIQEPDALGMAEDRIFAAGDFSKFCAFNSQTGRWNELPEPSGKLFTGNSYAHFLIGNQRWLVSSAGSVLAYDVKTGAWTNLSNLTPLQCAVAEHAGFWFGDDGGLQFYDVNSKSLRKWPAASVIQSPMNFLIGYPYTGRLIIPQMDLERLDSQIQDSIRNFEIERAKVHAVKLENKSTIDPLDLNWHIPGGVRAMANDGDFLWLGIKNYFGNYLLLLHQPSDSLVAYCPLDARGRISSLAASSTSVWVGMAYGDQLLFQLPKTAFLSIPQNRWTRLAISQEERARLIRTMSVRDRAIYAFYAGDDADVARLFADVNPDTASLEEMFLLAFSYDTLGLDKPDLCRSWFERIISRYPDSPWAQAAQTALSENGRKHKAKSYEALLLAKYDLNHNGVLDPAEKLAMQNDPDYQHEETAWKREQLGIQLERIMQQFDQNRDGKLDREELEHLQAQVNLFSQAPPEMLANHNIPVAPLLNRNLPSVSIILQKYDTNHDGGLDTNELRALAQAMQRKR